MSDEADETAMALLAEGMTRSEIAARMGTTKSAICGRLWRLQKRKLAMIPNEEPNDETIAAFKEVEAGGGEAVDAPTVNAFAEILTQKDDFRISPDQVPRDYERFDQWAHFACVEWHLPLLPLSLHATEGLRKGSTESFVRFMEEYSLWWILSEEDKLKRMHEVQRTSTSRLYYLERAKEAAFSSTLSRGEHS